MLQRVKECHRVLQSVTKYCKVLQSTTEYHRVLESISSALLGPIFGLVSITGEMNRSKGRRSRRGDLGRQEEPSGK